jgi:hypothetical protein
MKNAYILTFLVFVSLIVSCKSSKLPKGEQEVVNPCPTTNSKDYFRANAVGESMDQNASYDLAYTACTERLASSMNQKIEIMRDNYLADSKVGNGEDFKQKFQNLSRTIVTQSLIGVSVTCNKTVKTQEGKYKTYLAVELSATDLLNKYHQAISKDEQLKLDYDYEKFKKEFEKEMNKN